MTYHSSVQLMVGESEFHRWMFFSVSNKTVLFFLSMGLIGGSVGYIIAKSVKRFNR